MTGHKAEGLTVAANWALPDGTRQGGTVLVHAAGMDEPGLHVATSRHRDKVILFAGRDQLETPADTHDLGVPTTGEQLERRVVAGPSEQARTRPGAGNDTPVHDDLGRAAATRAPKAPLAPERSVPALDASMSWDELKAQVPGQPTAPAGTEDSPPVLAPRAGWATRRSVSWTSGGPR